MAVLVEAISVVVRRDAIEEKYRGCWSAFVEALPNGPMCADEELTCVGFLGPEEVEDFVGTLESGGLTFLDSENAVDLAVAGQQHGLTASCDWLEFGKLPFGEGRISACWFFDGERTGAGLHLRGMSMLLATPRGWVFEGPSVRSSRSSLRARRRHERRDRVGGCCGADSSAACSL